MTEERSLRVESLNGLVLAFSGDAIYEVYIRDHLIRKGVTRPKELHKRGTHYVSAKAQCMLIQAMLEANLLNEKEQLYYKRGRNAKSYTSAKNADITTYRISTGFEALMGFLHLNGQKERLEELIEWCITYVEEGHYHAVK